MNYLNNIKLLLIPLYIGVCLSFQDVLASDCVWYVSEGTIITGLPETEEVQHVSFQIFIVPGTTISGVEFFNEEPTESTSIPKQENILANNLDLLDNSIVKTSITHAYPSNQKSNLVKPKEKIQEKVARTDQKTQPQQHSKGAFPFFPKDKSPQLVTFITASTAITSNIKIVFNAAIASHAFSYVVLQKAKLQHTSYNFNLFRHFEWSSNHTSRPPPFLSLSFLQNGLKNNTIICS